MRVLYCNCSYRDLVPEDRKAAMRDALAEAQVDLTVVPDLCQWVADRDRRLTELLNDDELCIVACRPRAVRWLLVQAGVLAEKRQVRVFDLRELSPGDVCEQLGLAPPTPARSEAPVPAPEGEWVPWFPAIDYARCVNCRQCQSFCPFGVYALSAEGRVEVRNPRSCKNNCPACARVCPETAIIFPKYEQTPIDGSEVPADHVQQTPEALKERLAHANIHDLLAQRGKGTPQTGSGGSA